MADTPEDICNLALSHVDSEGTIEDLDPGLGEEERVCNLFYSICRRQVLSSHPWGFATKQVALSLSTLTTPVDTRWEYAYQYPSDCLKFERLINVADPDVKLPHKVINHDGDKVILTNEEDALGEYIIDVTDVTRFDPMFEMSLSYWLAAHIATPLTGSEQKRQNALTMYAQVHPGTKAKDANEDTDPSDEEVSWIKARA